MRRHRHGVGRSDGVAQQYCKRFVTDETFGITDGVAQAVQLARLIRRVIIENLLWAFAYNILLIPLAAGAFYPAFGLVIPPYFAGGAMALSSVSVVMNSLRLKRIKI